MVIRKLLENGRMESRFIQYKKKIDESIKGKVFEMILMILYF